LTASTTAHNAEVGRAATAVAALGLAAGGTAGPLLVADLAGEQAAGWPITLTLGAAVSAPLMVAFGARRDRVLALRAGHLVAASVPPSRSPWAPETRPSSSPANAAAAGSGPGHLARAMGTVLTATALGATASPLLLGPTAALAGTLRLPGATGLYLLATATYTLAALLLHRPQTALAAPKSLAQRGA
jgi:hypothetical protein